MKHSKGLSVTGKCGCYKCQGFSPVIKEINKEIKAWKRLMKKSGGDWTYAQGTVTGLVLALQIIKDGK